MSDIVEACISRARERVGRVVFPEGHDERIVAAARALKDQRIATPLLLGTMHDITEAAARAGVSLDGIATRDAPSSDRLQDYAQLYCAGRPDTSARIAERLVRKPLTPQTREALVAGGLIDVVEVRNGGPFTGAPDARARAWAAERGLAAAKSFGSYVDFATPGSPIGLGLYKRRALAKSAGVSEEGSGSHRIQVNSDGGSFTDPDGFEWGSASA